MFALVIFTMMVFSILNNLGTDIVDTPERATGGFDIRAETTRDLPVADIRADIEAAGNLDIDDFEVISAHTNVTTEARQNGAEERRFLELGVRGADETYLSEVEFHFSHYDPSYLPDGIDVSDDAAVARAIWDRLADDPSLAAITNDRLEVPAGGDFAFAVPGFRVDGVAADDPEQIDAFNVEVRQPRGRSEAVGRTVIAAIDPFAEGWEFTDFAGPFSGIYTRADVLEEISEAPVPFTTFRIRLAPGADAGRTAAAMETAFLDNSMEATDTLQEIKDGIAQNNAFGRLFQAFMGLGLVVGVASLGVMSFRAVVERRHSIGMMRAVGYRSGMIQAQFLIESVFVTILGCALGLGLGALISYNIIRDIGDSIEGLTFAIPWATVGTILAIAVIAALLTTFVPARQASRIYPSEALRYE
jgi:putative ABC transport system permease protein